jgi:hypothetical protein
MMPAPLYLYDVSTRDSEGDVWEGEVTGLCTMKPACYGVGYDRDEMVLVRAEVGLVTDFRHTYRYEYEHSKILATFIAPTVSAVPKQCSS